jgi:hypothetical protein
VTQYVNANAMSVGDIRNSRILAEVNTFLPNRVGKSWPAKDIRGEVWTPALVARRLMQAFKPKQRAIQGPKPYPNRDGIARFTADEDENGNRIADDGNRRIGAGADPIRAAAREAMPELSEFYQHCRPGDERLFYRMATFIMEYEARKSAPAPVETPKRVRPDRDTAKDFREARLEVKGNPARFAELVADDQLKNERDRYLVNDDILAIEAQEWIVAKLDDVSLENARQITLRWLKSGLRPVALAKRNGMSRERFKAIRVAFYSAIARRLNDAGVPVRRLRSRLDYRKRVLQGYGEIAAYLDRSIDGVIDHIAKGKIAVAEVDGIVIASGEFIRHDRKHRKGDAASPRMTAGPKLPDPSWEGRRITDPFEQMARCAAIGTVPSWLAGITLPAIKVSADALLLAA